MMVYRSFRSPITGREFLLRSESTCSNDSTAWSSRHTVGNGLGLSLVAAVAKLHDAQIEMLDNAPGLVFQLWFQRSAGDLASRPLPGPAPSVIN